MCLFKVLFLADAIEFLEQLEDKSRRKVLYNMNKVSKRNDGEILKKINDNIWEFRTLYGNTHIRFFAFWDTSVKGNSKLFITHGFIKKSVKLPMQEIQKVEMMRRIFFNRID
jgi:phage-related protein